MTDLTNRSAGSKPVADSFTEKEIATLIAQSATPIYTAAHYFGRSGIAVKTAVNVARDIVAHSINHTTVEMCLRLSRGEGAPVDLKTEVLDKVNALAATIENETAQRRATIEEQMMKRVLSERPR